MSAADFNPTHWQLVLYTGAACPPKYPSSAPSLSPQEWVDQVRAYTARWSREERLVFAFSRLDQDVADVLEKDMRRDVVRAQRVEEFSWTFGRFCVALMRIAGRYLCLSEVAAALYPYATEKARVKKEVIVEKTIQRVILVKKERRPAGASRHTNFASAPSTSGPVNMGMSNLSASAVK
jgi:hypothetical protein